MLTYLLQKLDEIKRQRSLYCSKDAVRCDARIRTPEDDATPNENVLKGKDLFLYELLCKNLREK